MFIEAIENRQGLKVCCPEEIAFRAGYINAAQLEALARRWRKTGYGEYLMELAAGDARLMEFEPTALPEVVLIKPQRVRGRARLFSSRPGARANLRRPASRAHFVQDNHSHSVRHTLRGLHYQIQQPQGKLVRVTRARSLMSRWIIRRSSPRFGQWVGVELSARPTTTCCGCRRALRTATWR